MKHIRFHARTAMLLLVVLLTTATAWAQQTVYQDGNVSIVQNSGGWQILIGKTVVGHGDGTLDVNNLPPAFQDMLQFYATQKEPAAKKNRGLSKAVPDNHIYGPLLTTTWNQREPYNLLCPKITIQEQGSGITKELLTLTGCSTTSSAQILNYYGYCNPFSVNSNDDPDNFKRTVNEQNMVEPYISSQYVSGVTLEENGEVSYKVNFPEYTPDFSKMDYDNNELAMLNVGVAFAQKAMLGTGGTGTPLDYQSAAFNKYFGYNAELTSFGPTNNGNLSAKDNVIATNIKQARPMLMCGNKADGGGHSYIIDGYNPENGEWHFNYGWGGSSDGWFSSSLYPNSIWVITTFPDFSEAVSMTNYPVDKLVITNRDNQTVTELTSVNGTEYEFATTEPLETGEYEFYFQYSDNTNIAPYTAGKEIQIKAGELNYRKHGLFSTTPAIFTLDGSYNLIFKHDLYHGEITIQAIKQQFTISGIATDDENKPVKGVVITTANVIPVEKVISIQTEKNGWSPLNGTTDMPFYPTTKYLSGFNFPLTIPYGTKGGDVTVAILDQSKTPLWQKTIARDEFKSSNIIKFDDLLEVAKGQRYYLRVSSVGTDDGGLWGYEWYNNDPVHTIYGYDDYFVTTDENGAYTYTVPISWSGTLNALSNEIEFNTQTIDNVTENLSGKNFEQQGLYRVTIFGSALDSYGKPVEGAVITEASDIPKEKIVSEIGNNAHEVLTSAHATFKAKTNYLTRLFLSTFVYSGNPGNMTVSILDKNNIVLWSETTSVEEHSQYKNIGCLKVIPDETYTIKVDAENNGGLYTYEPYQVKDENDKVTDRIIKHTVYGVDEYFVKTNSEGKYTYTADNSPWSGTLNAYSSVTKFNSLEFDEVSSNQLDQDFHSLTKYISGKVLDSHGHPIEGAYITEHDNTLTERVISEQADNGHATYNWLSSYKPIKFTPTKDSYLTKLSIFGWLNGNEASDLKVIITDASDNEVWQKLVSSANVKFDASAHLVIPIGDDKAVKVNANTEYVIKFEQGNTIVAYDVEGVIVHSIYGADIYAQTDETGSYTYSVTSPWKGSLNAISGNLKFNTLSFNGITESQTDQDFNCITKYISGKVLGKDNNPIAGVIITDNDKMPEPEIISQNVEPSTGGGTAVYIENHEVTINPTVNYLTKIFVESFIQDNPKGNYTVEILDKSRFGIWSKTMDENTFSTSVTPENPIHVTPGEPYYLKISVANTSGTWAINIYDGKMRYKVWGVSYEKTNSDGSYSYPVTTPWSGTLHAFSGDKKFNTLTFSGVSSNLTDKDFKENAQNIEYYSVTYKVDGEIYQTVGELQEGDDIPSLAEVPTKNGYVFKGWNPALPTTMSKGNLEVEAQWYKSLDNSDITVADIPSKTYNATAYTPSITVMDNGEALTGSDYEVSIPSNCIDAGEYTVTITGKGDNYAGEIKKTFSITRANLIVRADDNDKKYGDPDPKLTATIEGLLDGANIEYTVYRAEGEKVGDYAINVTGDAVQWNYNITYQSGQFAIINKKTLYGALIITENEKGKTAVLNADYNETTETMEITEAIQDISTLTYTRKFTKDATATVMLPFDFDVKDFKGTFRTLQSVAYDEEKKRWEATPSDAIEPEKGKLKANTPYIFIPTEDCGPFTFSDVTIIKPDFNNDNEITASTEAEKWELVGVYHYKVWSERMATEYGFAAIAGKGVDQDGNYMGNIEIGEFVRAGENSKIKPTRCFLRYSGSGELAQSKSTTELPDRIVLVLPDETASVIDPDDPSNNLDDNGDIKTPTSEINHNTIDAKVWAYDKTIYIEAQPNVAYSVIGLNGSVLINGITAADREEVRLSVKHDGVVIVVVVGKSFKIKY